MKRILFVDDEPRILAGLRRMLHGRRLDWDMAFAEGGEAALALMEVAPFDVVVTDMRMPGMDGGQLLAHVQERFPEAVRIVLSGHTELEAALRAIPISHQFLTKPCDADTLEKVVQRACGLQELLGLESTRQLVGRFGNLPAMPRVHAQLMKALADPETSLADVAAIVEQDLGITARLLQTVNSGFFSLRREITSTLDAVSFLGANMVKNLVLSMEVFQGFEEGPTGRRLSLAREQRHGLQVANLASRLLSDASDRERAFVAGLLHDFGKLVLASELPDYPDDISRAVRDEGRPFHALENERLGAGHAEIGAYLLGLWGLSYPIMEAVANHHRPERCQTTEMGICTAVSLANHLIHEQLGTTTGSGLDGDGQELEALVAALGATEQVDDWRRAAEDVVKRDEVPV